MTYNQNSGYGQALLNAVHSAVPTFGRIFVVTSTSDYTDERYQKMQETFSAHDGQVRFFTDLSAAYDATQTNNNDVIVLDGDTTFTLTAELNVTKNRVHFVGLDYLLGIHRKQGQSSKINIGVTTATGDVGCIINTGVRNSFRGLKITSSNTLTQALYAFMDGGEYTYMEDCEVAFVAKLTTATVADMLCNCDTGTYVNCAFGSTVNEITANGTRPNVLVTREQISGKVCRDCRFVNCDFLYKCGDTDNRFIYGANATDVERLLKFENCMFFSNPLGAQTPGAAVDFGSAQTEGAVILDSRCSIVDVTVMGATGKAIYVMAPSSPTYATSGLSVAA